MWQHARETQADIDAVPRPAPGKAIDIVVDFKARELRNK